MGVDTLKTNSGNIVLWSNSDKGASQGSIYLESGASLLSNGGKIWIGGGLDDGGADALITTDRGKWSSVVSGDALPDGYSVGWNQVDNWGIGVVIGVGTTLKSANGDIFIAGQQAASGTSGYGHIGIWNGAKIDSGDGKIALWGRSQAGATDSTQGIALHATSQGGLATVIRSNSNAAAKC